MDGHWEVEKGDRRQAGKNNGQTNKQTDESMNGGMGREKEVKHSCFQLCNKLLQCNAKVILYKTTHCLQLTVCSTPLSKDLVTGHCESVNYPRLNRNHWEAVLVYLLMYKLIAVGGSSTQTLELSQIFVMGVKLSFSKSFINYQIKTKEILTMMVLIIYFSVFSLDLVWIEKI